ncbi:MAG: sulfatase [Aristaeellaceae bacterium]
MTRPSILFITTDEQHLDTLYRTDMPYELPALHSLMACSDVYTQAYSASPVCLPARCTWMTGLMPHRNGCISNNFGATLPLQLPNLFTCLRQAGYSSSMHGKCHFAPCPYPAVRPYLTQGYETFKVYYQSLGMDHLDLQDGNSVSMWYYDDCGTDLEKQGLMREYRRRFITEKVRGVLPDYPHAAETHPDSWTGRKALAYLDQCKADQPHLMWVSFSGPHYPMDVPSEYMERVDMDRDIPRRWREGEWDDETKHNRMGYFGTGPCTEGGGNAPEGAQKNFTESYWRRWRQKYYANIVQIDDYIGQIIDKARSIWGDNLYIVFTADHGDMMGNHSLWGKNSALYNDVLRVPLVVHHPGQTERKDVTELVSSTDVFPTLLEMGGCEPVPGIDGRPLEAVAAQGGRPYVISSTEGRVAIVKGDWKLCLNGVGFELDENTKIYREMYNLADDPCEFTNLYGDERCVAHREELEAILQSEPNLLRTVFRQRTDPPYWFNAGNGAGYERNGL